MGTLNSQFNRKKCPYNRPIFPITSQTLASYRDCFYNRLTPPYNRLWIIWKYSITGGQLLGYHCSITSYNWLNLSINSFKIDCKKIFLSWTKTYVNNFVWIWFWLEPRPSLYLQWNWRCLLPQLVLCYYFIIPWFWNHIPSTSQLWMSFLIL